MHTDLAPLSSITLFDEEKCEMSPCDLTRVACLLTVVALSAATAEGYIHFPPMTLSKMCKDSHQIRVLEVEKFDKEKGGILFKCVQTLKDGQSKITSFRVILRAGATGTKPILDWLKDGGQAVMFSMESTPRDAMGAIAYVFIDGYCFSTQYHTDGKFWLVIRGEPGLSACYHGPAAQLSSLVRNLLAGKEAKVPRQGPDVIEDRGKRNKEISEGLKRPQRDERKEQKDAVEAIRKLGGEVIYYEYHRPNPDKPNVFDPAAKPKDPDAFHRVVCVSLRDTKVTDDDIKVLAKLSDLENLDLTNTRITGAGLAHLKGLRNLRVLGLWKTQVDDAGLEHIKGLTKMWQLVLDETKVTDAGLVHLKGMTGLEVWLGLTDTQITDDGLKRLEGFTKLRSLNLRRTQVTEAGVRKLRAALPNTDISFGP